MVLSPTRRGALFFCGLVMAAFCIRAALYAPADVSDAGQSPPATAASASLDGIALAAPDAAAVTVPSAPSAWGGARTGAEATLSDRVVN